MTMDGRTVPGKSLHERRTSDQNVLDEYALSTLPEDDARRIRAHVERCGACRKLLEEREDLLGTLALAVPGAEPPARLEESIMRKIAEAPQPRAARGLLPSGTALSAGGRMPRAGRSFLGSPAFAAIAAVLIIALAAGNLIQWLRGGSPREAAPVCRSSCS